MAAPGLRVIYGKKSKMVTLQRSLVSLIMYYPSEVTLKHLVVLFDNLLRMQDKCEKDPDFQKKFGITLKVLAYILKNLNLSKPISYRTIERLSEKFRENLKHFALEKRNTKQPLQQQYAQVEVRPSHSTGIPVKQLPPKRFIGIGYTDKGTARNPAVDASPTWQEVARVPIERLSNVRRRKE